MTKEEREKAIKALKWFKEYNEEDYCGGDRIQDEHGDWYYRVTEQDFEIFDMIIKALEQEPILDKINRMKSEIADSLEFWDYSPNNNPLARDMLETITNFWGDMREE